MLKVQTRTTLEQKMLPIKNEQFRTTKKHDHIAINHILKKSRSGYNDKAYPTNTCLKLK